MSTTELTVIEKAKDVIAQAEKDFTAVENLKLSFQKEMGFAIQILEKNKYLTGLALANPADLRTAIYNVALTGLSLNPVLKHGYIMPRGGKIIFEPSYMGLTEVLIQAGTITQLWAYLVYEADSIHIELGATPNIIHTQNIMKSRGRIVGAYAVAVLPSGARQFEIMTYEQLMKIKARSESVKAGKGSPWDNDEEEMICKTVVRRIFKKLPKTSLSESALTALRIFDENNAIDFNAPVGVNENDPAIKIREAQLKEQPKQLTETVPVHTELQPPEPTPVEDKEAKIQAAIEKGLAKISQLTTAIEFNENSELIGTLQNPIIKETLADALIEQARLNGFELNHERGQFEEVETDETIIEPEVFEEPVPEPAKAQTAKPAPAINMQEVYKANAQSKKASFSF